MLCTELKMRLWQTDYQRDTKMYSKENYLHFTTWLYGHAACWHGHVICSHDHIEWTGQKMSLVGGREGCLQIHNMVIIIVPSHYGGPESWHRNETQQMHCEMF